MAFLAFTSAQMDADSPWTETVTQLIRTNFDDHESRIGSNESISDGAIRDDFVGTAIDTDTWDTAVGGSGAIAQDGQPDHFMHMSWTTQAGSHAAFAATTKRMRFDLSRNHDVVMQARIKLTAATDMSLFFGLQDTALAIGQATTLDTTNMIGFLRGTNSNSLKFRTAGGGVSAETDNLGNSSAWTKLYTAITATGLGATISITVKVDDVEISGSPFVDETKITLSELRPYFGISTGGTATQRADVDYVLAYWNARPLSN